MLIREETNGDEPAIAAVVTDAFAGAMHSSGTEAAIIERLRAAGALAVSLVASDSSGIVGHVAVTPVTTSDGSGSWFGIGPIAVRPDRQKCGIGGALIKSALERVRTGGAAGCVVLGEPSYYCRFGFQHDPSVSFSDAPPPYFQVLPFGKSRIKGAVEYHEAFE
jgi:putative acetyltransferase